MSSFTAAGRRRLASPRRDARIAGALYLVIIICGAFAEAFVRQRLTVPGDATATAVNILGQEQLYRLGFVADLVSLVCNVLLAVLFYDLFRIVSTRVAALVVLFTLAGTAIQASVLVYHLAPLILLQGVPASMVPHGELEALSYSALRLQTSGYNIALAFFGCYDLSLGYLVLKASFLPRIIGVFMAIAGLCYVVNSLLSFVAPSLSSILLLLPVLLGEGGLTLWLLVVGVDSAKWKAQAENRPGADAASPI
jgi:hypothetical protein